MEGGHAPADSPACFLTASRSRMKALPSAFEPVGPEEARRRWINERGAGATARERTRAANIVVVVVCAVWLSGDLVGLRSWMLEKWADG